MSKGVQLKKKKERKAKTKMQFKSPNYTRKKAKIAIRLKNTSFLNLNFKNSCSGVVHILNLPKHFFFFFFNTDTHFNTLASKH